MPGTLKRVASTTIGLWMIVAVSFPASAGELGPADATVYSPAFEDVTDTHTFAGAIRALLESGITRGCNETATRFCPDRPVTRAEMAAFLVRALSLPEGNGIDFTDDNHSTFENDIERLAAAQITRGCNPPDNSRFCPDRPVTRAEMAAFLTRALPLEVPPPIPEGVELTRESIDAGRGTKISACRETGSLMVRSVTGASPGLAERRSWPSSTLSISAGQLDLATDRWFVPAGEGCETLEVAWNPRSNTLLAPLDHLDVSSSFGYRVHPIYGGLRLHTGTDFRADTGALVYAAADGVVVEAAYRGGYGLMVEIRHPGGLDTRYAHLSAMDVAIGALVGAGQVVGRVGCTGACTGPHLHFETLEFDLAVDPMSYLAP